MDEFNFEQLKNLKAPESFVQNALRIPEQTPPSTRPWFLSPFAVSAAAAVLMLLVGLSLFTGVFGGDPVAVRPQLETTQQVKDGADKTRIVSETNGELHSSADGETTPLGVQPVTVIRDGRVYTVFPSDSKSRVANQAVSDPSEDQSSRYNGSAAATAAQEIPTSVSSFTEPAETTVPGNFTEPLTEPCAFTEPLTEPCAFTDPATIPTTDPCEEKPPAENTTTAQKTYFRGKLQITFKMGDYPVELYCTIYDSRGNNYGGDRATSIVLVNNGTGEVTVYYTPSARGVKLPCGTYTAVFRDVNGAVAAQGAFTVTDNSPSVFHIPVIRG